MSNNVRSSIFTKQPSVDVQYSVFTSSLKAQFTALRTVHYTNNPYILCKASYDHFTLKQIQYIISNKLHYIHSCPHKNSHMMLPIQDIA